MGKRRAILVICIGVVLCLVVWWCSTSNEPLCRGKRVTEWVEIYCQDGTNAHLHFLAVCSLINLGTNAAPHIFRMAATHDSAIKKILLKIPLPDELLDFMKIKARYKRWADTAADRPQMATRAFDLMGRENKSFLPQLIELLSSDNPASRLAAAQMLRTVAADAQKAVPILVNVRLRDPDSKVRAAADEALRAISSNTPDRRGASQSSPFSGYSTAPAF